MRLKQLLKKLTPFITIALFLVACYVLWRQLRNHDPSQLWSNILDIKAWELITAIGLTMLGYIALSGYDIVAVKFRDRNVPTWKPMLAGLLGYSFTNTTGHAVIVGGFIRLRIYPAWGFKASDVGFIVVFGMMTYWLGLITMSGLAFVLEPHELGRLIRIDGMWIRMIGIGLLLLLAVYLLICGLRKQPVKLWKWEFRLPNLATSIMQTCVSCLDLAIAASVLWVLLPDDGKLPLLGFFGLFAVVQFIALMSLVPGGLGVFATLMVLALGQGSNPTHVLGSILVFRAIYYLAPFVLGVVAFGCFTLSSRKAIARFYEDEPGATTRSGSP